MELKSRDWRLSEAEMEKKRDLYEFEVGFWIIGGNRIFIRHRFSLLNLQCSFELNNECSNWSMGGLH